MKILLLGATGFVGRRTAAELAGRSEVRELLLVDYNVRDAKKFARKLSPRARFAMADAGKEPELARLLDGVSAVASAVGPCAEYEKTVLLACARRKVPVASIGDGPIDEPARKEIQDAFRVAGVPAVSGCGLCPGWTELLAAHWFAGGGEARRAAAPLPFLFVAPDRFGGYAFFRRVARNRAGRAEPPRGAPPGMYVAMGDGSRIGVPEGKASARFRALEAVFGRFGTVGEEFLSAFLYWMREGMKSPPEAPAAAAGLFLPREEGDGRTALVTDPQGRLPGLLLAESALRLAAMGGSGKGLLPVSALLDGQEARKLLSRAGATATVSRT